MTQLRLVQGGVQASRPRKETDIRIFEQLSKWIAELEKHNKTESFVAAYRDILASLCTLSEIRSLSEIRERFSEISSMLFARGYACRELIQNPIPEEDGALIDVVSESILAARLFEQGARSRNAASDLKMALQEQRRAWDLANAQEEQFEVMIRRQFDRHPVRSVLIGLVIVSALLCMALSQAWGI